MTGIWARQSVGEHSLGYDLRLLGCSDRSRAGAIAGIESLLANMLFAHESYFIIDLVRDFRKAGERPEFTAVGAIHFVIRDLMNHCDFGKVGDFASVTLMAEPGAPLPALSRDTITVAFGNPCLLISLGRRLLFGGTAKNGAVTFID
ncbi:MAG TPA: hypothetical protein DEH07_00460 [Desulfotomaculum sp.]|nr:hypothetical protein [Desulfotomaculum sp.]